MRIPDKKYDAMRPGVMSNLISTYRKNMPVWEEERWDCDDIARDFWNFAKQVRSHNIGENSVVGMIDFPEHTQIVFVQEKYTENMNDSVYYVDQRDWSIRKPDRKPKMIIM